MPNKDKPIIKSISAPCQDISLNRQAKMLTNNPKYLTLTNIM